MPCYFSILHMSTSRYLTWNPFSSQNFFGGMYTDDCEMTLGLMRGLMAEGVSLGESGMIDWWRREYERSQSHFWSTRVWAMFGVGRNGHGSMRWVYEGSKSIDEVRKFQTARTHPGNAGPMRALPISFIADPLVRLQLAVRNSDSTHPHPKSRAATFAIVEAGAWLMLRKQAFKTVISACIECLKLNPEIFDQETVRYLEVVDALPDYHQYSTENSVGSGWLSLLEQLQLWVSQPIGWATEMRGSQVRGLDSRCVLLRSYM